MIATESGTRMRNLAVLILRVGLGMVLLNAGLIGYLAGQRGMGPPFGIVRIGPGAGPLFEILPYIETALGLALILGFFTAAAAVAAAFFFMVTTLFQLLVAMGTGMGMNLQFAIGSISAPNLMLCAAVVWFSPLATNPWSLDRVMFARREEGPVVLEPVPPAAEPTEPLAPGERVARFMAGREE